MSYAAVAVGWTVLLFAGAVGAVSLLRRAWGDRTILRPWWIAAGWGGVAALVIVGGLTLGLGRGSFIAFTVVSIAGLAGVVANVQVREVRTRGGKSFAPEPSDRASKAWRGWLRALLAGPLGMVAAMGVAICFSAFCPGAAQTRLVVGGLMVPLLWGGAMAWTLADDKILRATAVLVGVSLLTFTAAILRGFS